MTLPPQYVDQVQSLLREIREQRKQMEQNQAAMEQQLNGIAENVRTAKIFATKTAR